MHTSILSPPATRRADWIRARRQGGRCGRESKRPREREENIIRKFQIPATASSNRRSARYIHQALVGDPLLSLALSLSLTLTIVALFFWDIAIALSSLSPPSLIPLLARFLFILPGVPLPLKRSCCRSP
ncbi:hypothetical protein ACQKWADRAFT_155891 [Trichoderma austrokoningii]